jgi:rubrerythrin
MSENYFDVLFSGEDYDPSLHITAGALRSMGLIIPAQIPDVAWIPREMFSVNFMDAMDKKDDCSISFGMNLQPSRFVWKRIRLERFDNSCPANSFGEIEKCSECPSASNKPAQTERPQKEPMDAEKPEIKEFPRPLADVSLNSLEWHPKVALSSLGIPQGVISGMDLSLKERLVSTDKVTSEYEDRTEKKSLIDQKRRTQTKQVCILCGNVFYGRPTDTKCPFCVDEVAGLLQRDVRKCPYCQKYFLSSDPEERKCPTCRTFPLKKTEDLNQEDGLFHAPIIRDVSVPEKCTHCDPSSTGDPLSLAPCPKCAEKNGEPTDASTVNACGNCSAESLDTCGNCGKEDFKDFNALEACCDACFESAKKDLSKEVLNAKMLEALKKGIHTTVPPHPLVFSKKP